MTRLLVRGINAVLIVVIAVVCVLLVWLAHPSSLASTLRWLPQWLPAAQGLSAENVNGSLWRGGTVGVLRWQAQGMRVEVKNLRIAYDLRDLLERRLEVSVLHADQLHLDDQRPPSPATATSAPDSLQLPITLQVNLGVDQLFLQPGQPATLSDLQARYQFDGQQHRLEQGRLRLASGQYEFQAQLQAQGLMQLQAQVEGRLSAPRAGKGQAIPLLASASLVGDLAPADSTLALQARVQAATTTPGAAGTELKLQARVQPWQAQPIAQAKAQWKALDLAQFWQPAPHTQLSGRLDITPKNQAWEAQVQVDNQANGPWDQQRLPIRQLQASLSYQQASWSVRSLQLDTGQGQLQAQGRYQQGSWRVLATLQNLLPDGLDSRLQGGPISGTVALEQGKKTLTFDARLNAPAWSGPTTTASWPVHLRALQTTGTWSGTELVVQALQLATNQASVAGSGKVRLDRQEGALDVRIDLPGLQATIQGDLAETQGQGQLQLTLIDARSMNRWLARWPQLAALVPADSLDGQADLRARWQGGWKDYLNAVSIDATLEAPTLKWLGDPQAAPLSVHGLKVQAQGTPAQLRIKTDGRAEIASQQLQWGTQAVAQLSERQASLQLDDLRLNWQRTRQAPTWSLQLEPSKPVGQTGVRIDWSHDAQTRALRVSSGQARISGPMAGASTVQWGPTQWERVAGQTARWSTTGQLDGLPLDWIEAVSPKALSDLGLSSDLIFKGQWRLTQTDTMSVQASLERSRGDVRLNTGDRQQPILPAELSEASVRVDLNGQALAASLRWDSSRAGRALVAFSTTLRTDADGWAWPDAAPVAASIQMRSPPAQAWTALAPPGWRLRGVVDANMTLTGTRSAPLWAGSLRARDLALRSLVHGLDFDRGTLDASLKGQQLTIERARLQGAGANGGALDLSGTVDWITDSRLPKIADHLRMALTAELSAFRVSVRPDRRISASGSLKASFANAKLDVSGALKADQALITLPDDNAPSLGDDVVIRTTKQDSLPTLTKNSTAPPTSPMAFKLRVQLDPGSDFKIRGRGLEGRLGGALLLQSQGPGTTQLTGTLETLDGVYQAYGQRLNIEQGRLLFEGVIDNPTLDILAIRPQLTQRVGVQVSGTVLSPVVRLYADPDVPDVEKLSWLLTGRAPSAGGAEAALLQQAALSLLKGSAAGSTSSLAQAFGLDELSLQNKTTPATGATAEASTASITLGKRLSKDVYVAYEHSLAGTVGAFSFFYDLSQRLTLRAQTGEQTAIDLIFTLRYD